MCKCNSASLCLTCFASFNCQSSSRWSGIEIIDKENTRCMRRFRNLVVKETNSTHLVHNLIQYQSFSIEHFFEILLKINIAYFMSCERKAQSGEKFYWPNCIENSSSFLHWLSYVVDHVGCGKEALPRNGRKR